MMRESERLRTHLGAAAYGMSRQEFKHALSSISELIILDKEHQIQLRKIEFMIETLLDPDIDLFKLNLTEIEAIHSIGWKVVEAYGNLINYTSVDYVNGPPLFYFGPSPPDEVILEEAAQLAADVTTKISYDSS